jgi:hypothetical protein
VSCNGVYHSYDGPAISYKWFVTDGAGRRLKFSLDIWLYNGVLHRSDEPAMVTTKDNHKKIRMYWIDGRIQERADEPSIIIKQDHVLWSYMNKCWKKLTNIYCVAKLKEQWDNATTSLPDSHIPYKKYTIRVICDSEGNAIRYDVKYILS